MMWAMMIESSLLDQLYGLVETIHENYKTCSSVLLIIVFYTMMHIRIY